MNNTASSLAVSLDCQSGRLMPAAELVLKALLADVLGSGTGPVEYHVVKTRDDYAVLFAGGSPQHQRVVVKLAGPRATFPCPFDRTAALHRRVAANTDVPVACALVVDTSYTKWPWRYLVQEYIAGEEWALVRSRLEGTELTGAYRQIGHAVAGLHSVVFPSFGELSPDGTVDRGLACFEALQARARRRLSRPEHLGLFLGVLEERRALFANVGEASLVHEDLHGYNIKFRCENGHCQLAAFLDFDSAWAGHHQSDLARLEIWRGMTGDGFWDAYTEERVLPAAYNERRPVYQLLWCLEYASTSQQHLVDTHLVCDELGISGVTFEEPGRGREGRQSCMT